jgi:hypothetical protein
MRELASRTPSTAVISLAVARVTRPVGDPKRNGLLDRG